MEVTSRFLKRPPNMDAKEKKKSIFTDVMDLAGLNEPMQRTPSAVVKPPGATTNAPYPNLTSLAAASNPFLGFYAVAAAAQLDPYLYLTKGQKQPLMMPTMSPHLLPFAADTFGRFMNPFLTSPPPIFNRSTAAASILATSKRSPSHSNSKSSSSATQKCQLKLPAHPPTSLNLISNRNSKAGAVGNAATRGGMSTTLTSGGNGGVMRQAPRFQCPDCNRSYSTFSGLSKHRQFHCASQLKRQFGCKFCDKQYSSLGALKMHIRTHTLPCKCQICGKAFSRPWLLQGHLRTHTGEKPFRCCHCGRAFADRSNLRAHLQTHSEIKKYRCKTCQKTFSRMSLLSKHESNGCPGIAPNSIAD